MSTRIWAAFLTIALINTANPAMSQQVMQCGPRKDIAAQLLEKFGEIPAGRGTVNGYMIELLTSDAGTWTLLMSFPTGKSCLMATGDSWQTLTAAKLGMPI